MKCNIKEIIPRVIKKAEQSSCRFRVAAIGIDFRGRVIGVKHNQPSYKKNRGLHAEANLMRSVPSKSLSTIVIVRIGAGGAIRPIKPCDACRAMADKIGVNIRTVEEER